MNASVSLSALNVTQTYLNSTSHNLANTSTDNFKPLSVVSAEIADSGVGMGTEVSSVRQAGESGVNLNRELTDLKSEETVYKANAKVLQVENNTLGSLLDITA